MYDLRAGHGQLLDIVIYFVIASRISPRLLSVQCLVDYLTRIPGVSSIELYKGGLCRCCLGVILELFWRIFGLCWRYVGYVLYWQNWASFWCSLCLFLFDSFDLFGRYVGAILGASLGHLGGVLGGTLTA